MHSVLVRPRLTFDVVLCVGALKDLTLFDEVLLPQFTSILWLSQVPEGNPKFCASYALCDNCNDLTRSSG